MIQFVMLIIIIFSVVIALLYWPFIMKSDHQDCNGQGRNETENLPQQRQPLPSAVQTQKQQKTGHWVLLPAVIVLISLSIGLYSGTGHWRDYQHWQQAIHAMPALRVSFNAGDHLNYQQRRDLMLGLRSQLQQQPDNWQEWFMLGRLALISNEPVTAIEAFAKAYQIAPQHQDVALSYIQLLMRSNDPADNRQANRLLRQRLQRYHPDMQTLRLLATSSYELGYLEQAIAAWQLMLMLLPEDNPYREMLMQSIKQAEQQQNSTL